MSNNFYFDKSARYKLFSKQAAEFERQRKYRRAIEQWEQAKLNASNKENEKWCQDRINLCEWKEKNGM